MARLNPTLATLLCSVAVIGWTAPAWAANTAIGTGAVSQGANETSTGNGAVTVGNLNTSTGTGTVAIGNQNTATGNGSVAIGNLSTATATGGVALGASATATNTNDVALGSNSVSAAANPTSSATISGTTYGGFAGTSPGSVVSIGQAGQERQLTNVAAGRITATSTDAVNGSELYSVTQTLSQEIAGVGAGTGPSVHYFSVNDGGTQQGNYNNNGATGANALAVGTNAAAAGANSVSMGPGATAGGSGGVAIGQGAAASLVNSVALGAGATASGASNIAGNAANHVIYNAGAVATGSGNVVSVGSSGNERQIQNVAAGAVNATSTDAVNGSQLYSVAQMGTINVTSLGQSTASYLGGGSTYSNGALTAPTYNIGGGSYHDVGSALNALQNETAANLRKANSGIASALAAAALRYDERPGKWSVALGGGLYQSQTGIAAGVGATSESGLWRYNAALTISPSQSRQGLGASMGLSYTFN